MAINIECVSTIFILIYFTKFNSFISVPLDELSSII